jgi:outer membrane biosynthesis protein TonB
MQLHHYISQSFNCLKLHFSQNKMLLLAAIVSLVLHTVLLTKFSLTLPVQDVSQQTLAMRLVKLQPAQKSAPVPIKEKTPNPEPAPPTEPTKPIAAQPQPEPVLEHTIIPFVEVPTTVEPIPSSTSLHMWQAPPPANADPAPSEISPPLHATESGDAAEAPEHQAYRHIETEFEVRRGSDSTTAGTAKIVFNSDENGRYTITSTTQAKGLTALFFGTLIQKSEGTVTESGLMPNFFKYQYGNDDKKMQYANFAWSDGTIEMNSPKGKKTGHLAEGTQDLLSFMYQFMFTPPLTNMQITMTNGKNLRTYTYSFEGEKPIATKLGELKTIHLVKNSAEDDKTEIWLATDYQFIPVKIRKTEKNGSVIEQTVTHISTELPE